MAAADFEVRARAALAESEKRTEKRGRLRKMIILAAPFCALLMFVSVTEKSVEDDPMGVVTAARLWAENGPGSYEMTYERHGSDVGTMGPATVIVEDRTVVAYATEDPRLEDAVALSVERMLLAIEQAAVDGDVDVLVALYDEDLGHPTDVTFSHGSSSSTTWGFRVIRVVPTDSVGM
jgi:hypothetical protein